MKKIISSGLFTSLFLSFSSVAFAQQSRGGTGGGVSGGGLCPSGDFSALCTGKIITNPTSIIGNFISFIFVLAVVVALLYLIWGGFKWLTSGGDKTAVGAAREHIVAAIVGLILIFLSYFILNLLLSFFVHGLTLNTITIPQITQ